MKLIFLKTKKHTCMCAWGTTCLSSLQKLRMFGAFRFHFLFGQNFLEPFFFTLGLFSTNFTQLLKPNRAAGNIFV